MALNVTQVNQGFLALLGRPATGAEATKFAAISDVVTLGNAIAADAALSTEIVTPFPELIQPDLNAASNELFVESLYVSLIGRASDADGKTFWLGALTAGANRADVLSQFISALEAQAVEGTTDGQAFLDKQAENVSVIHTWLEELYANTLGRSADQEGLDFWTNAVLAGTTPAAVAANFAVALAAQGDTTTDGQIFANKTTAANSFTASFNDFNSFVSDAEKKALYNELRDMIKEIDQNTKPEDYAESIATKVNTYEKSKLANISYTSADDDELGVDEDGNVNTTSAVHFKGTYNLADEAKGTIQSTDQITGNDLYENNILEVGVTGITTEAKNLELGNVLGTIQNDSIQKLIVNNNKATVSGEINGAQWKTIEINGGGGSTIDDVTNLTIGADANLSVLKIASTANTTEQNVDGFYKNAVIINGDVATVTAGAGSDSITAAGTVNNVNLGAGNDRLTVFGTLGNATLGAGDDTLNATGQILKDSTISLGAGDDEATLNLTTIASNVNRSNITVDLGAGDDTLTLGTNGLAKVDALATDGIQKNIALIGGAGNDVLVLTNDNATSKLYTAVSEISSFETIRFTGTNAASGATISAEAADGLRTALEGTGTLNIDADKYAGKIDLSGITKVDEFQNASLGGIVNASNVDVALGALGLASVVGTDYSEANKTTGNDTIKVSGQLKNDMTIDGGSVSSTDRSTDNINLTGLKVDKDAAKQDLVHNIEITQVGAENSVIELSKKGVANETISINAQVIGELTQVTIKNYELTAERTDGKIELSGAGTTLASAGSADTADGKYGFTIADGVLTITDKATSNQTKLTIDAIRAYIADDTAITAKIGNDALVGYQLGNDFYLIGAGATAAANRSDDIIIKLTGVKDVATVVDGGSQDFTFTLA